MLDGEGSALSGTLTAGGTESSIGASLMVEPSLTLSPSADDDQVVSVAGDPKEGKDPRKKARRYQLELCKKALGENVIVYLGTGYGKTHIAVLLMYEMRHLIQKPQNNVCVFLAPTVALAQQQARVIEDSIDLKVGIYCGSCKHLKSHRDWMKELEQNEVLVMTPQVLLHNLSHCFIKMELIALLIFDECHHAQVKSNHQYAEIMRVFYKSNATKLPRIFGMTASPVVGRGASDSACLAKCINSLEKLLDAKVYSVINEKELHSFVATPVLKIYDYGAADGTLSPHNNAPLCGKLEEMKRQCLASLYRNEKDHQNRKNMQKLLNRVHDNLMFCLENLGVWGALHACHILLSSDQSQTRELVDVEGVPVDDSLCHKYLAYAAELLSSDCVKGHSSADLSAVEVLKEPFFSRKVLCLVGILSSFRSQPSTKCIIFVNRIITARSLSYMLQKIKILAAWRSGYLVGIHSGLKSMSRNTMNAILEKFRCGKLNLLVATKVGEEGLDIQTCCLVIRFDLPETVASFIQSRGRARMPQSEYAFLVDRSNEKDINLIENFKREESQMKMEIVSRSSNETFDKLGEKVYRVDASGASITSGSSISLLYRYCSKLPHDEYYSPRPSFFYFDDLGGTICHITMPPNAPIHQIVGTPQCSMEAAKKDACLKAIEDLHKFGVLDDFLLPVQSEELLPDSSDSDSCEEDSFRGDLHEMIVPSSLRKAWTDKENSVRLFSYYIKFNPDPKDRIYKTFGLFVKTCLPIEAEIMELDLHLAHGRSVMTRLLPSGISDFNKDEIKMAQNFQEMFLKIILDRSDIISEFVHLGRKDYFQSTTSTFYLLLPIVLPDFGNRITVDWKLLRRCLSSPIFRHPADAVGKETFPSTCGLQLADGYRSIEDIENSLIYVPHKNVFYFVTNIVHEKNGFSPYSNSDTLSYMHQLIDGFSIHLKYPEQPLLHAKPLFSLHNLLYNRKKETGGSHELEEYFVDLPPEICQLKIIGFSKDIGSSISLLPSVMHRLENLLVAIDLKQMLSSSFPEGAEVTAHRVLEALTTEKCQERFSLERLEILGDAFLKYAVGRHVFLMHDSLDEGDLTRKRSNAVNNSNLFRLATKNGLQVYIRDQKFDPSQFFALGRPCPRVCTKETEAEIHSQYLSCAPDHSCASEFRCSKNHHWLYKKTIADVVEALVGAFLVDSGFKAATAFLRWIGVEIGFEASQVVKLCAASTSYMPMLSDIDIPSLEDKLGYQFLHKGLLAQAFIHPSYNKHGVGCYQRMEFLGDAVLDYLITSYLYSVYPKLKPGQLTDLKSLSVNNKAFANVTVDRSFHEYLLSDSDNLTDAIKKYVNFIKVPLSGAGDSDGPKCPKVLGDLVESCFGAILLDSGFNLRNVWKIMMSFLDPIMSFSCLQLSPTRDLRELCQSYNLELDFLPSKEASLFLVEGKVKGTDICVTASATAPNKKDAVRISSQQLFMKLKAQGFLPKSKSLEEVLKSSPKLEANLIGYDETPIDVTTDVVEDFLSKERICNISDASSCCITEVADISSNCAVPVSRLLHSSYETIKRQPNETIDTGSIGESHKGTARSRLYELCSGNYWKPPIFECQEEGPSHLLLFTVKVTVEIEGAQDMILECYGEPRSKKKDAVEHAAEGALWYLQLQGYIRG